MGGWRNLVHSGEEGLCRGWSPVDTRVVRTYFRGEGSVSRRFTGGSGMKLTLSIDEHLVREARRAARAMGKSLNQLVRDYLEQLTARDDPRREIEEIRRLSMEGKGRSRGWRFNRDEPHGYA